MRTIKSLISELQKFPEDALCYAYEGEVTGVIIGDGGSLGYIECCELDNVEDSPAEIRQSTSPPKGSGHAQRQ